MDHIVVDKEFMQRKTDMNKDKNQKLTTNCQGYLRIKDKHSHFLGEVQNGLIRIYCRRCKEFHEVPVSQLIAETH